jgi:hypothetical protein
MLPPFVPPSARVSNETLPLITEFVIDPVERSFDNSFSTSGDSVGIAVATLPSIDEFIRTEAAPEQETGTEAEVEAESVDEFVQRTSRSPWGTYEAQSEVSGEPHAAPASLPLEPDLLAIEHRSPSGAEDAIVNEVVEPAEAWAASAAGPREGAPPAAEPSPVAPEGWVAEERDAFDWKAAANLAVPPAEEQRAADEWSSTEWDRSSGSVQEHIATVLAQVSRRVRAGELEVQGSKQMGPEAAIVAVLAALLAEPGRK